MSRNTPAPRTEPVLWPRYVPGRGTVMEAIDASRIPAGWQSVSFRVPMRLATCEETDCPLFLKGWTQVVMADGNTVGRPGAVSRDEAAQTFGYYGVSKIPPEVVFQRPGTPCPEIHKVPNGMPPIFNVNGRTVLWTEFEDSVGGGLYRAQQLQREGQS